MKNDFFYRSNQPINSVKESSTPEAKINARVKDLRGIEYPLQATIETENEVNGNQSLSATILATETNKDFIADIQEMWHIFDHDNVEHKIIYAKRKGIGQYRPELKDNKDESSFFFRPNQSVIKDNKKELMDSTQLSVEIKAEPLFFNEMDNDRIYDNINRHMTAMEAFTLIFSETNFDFTLADNFDAVGWEGFGNGDSKLETFKRALERYKAEFRIAGDVIYLERQIGRDTQFQYRHRLNSTNIEQEIDAEELWTYARGYGDYGNDGGSDEDSSDDTEDWENAKLVEEYTSPLADVIGVRHAPPKKDGRITKKERMQEELKNIVDESLKISVSADVYDLKNQGYPIAQSEVGDRVYLIDERINLDDEVRVISQSKTRNWKGKVIDLSVTFGSEGLTKRHQSQLNTAASDLNDLMEGNLKLPYSVLPAAEQNALRALNAARTELIFGNAENGVQGIIAQEKDDPNRIVWLNSAGWMISTDGGATSKVAATADGIVADVITTGTLNTDQIVVRGGDEKDYIHMQGAEIESHGKHLRKWRTNKGEEQYVKLKFDNGQFRARNDTEEWSLYFNDQGITTWDNALGNGSAQASGYLEFHSKQYSGTDTGSGLTIGSDAGRLALETDGNRLYMNPSGSDVWVADMKENFYDVRMNHAYVSSIRSHPDGSSGEGNLYIGVSGSGEREVRVTNFDFYNGGDTGYRPIRVSELYSEFGRIIGRNGTQLDLGNTTGEKYVRSKSIYNRKYTSTSQMVRVTETGTLGRSTSSRRYKLLEEEIDTEYAYNLLKLDAKTWHDKHACEDYAEHLHSGKESDKERIGRIGGVIAEDVYDSGLEMFVSYDEEGRPEGIEQNIWTLLIPIIKDQQKRIEKLEAQING